MAKSGRAGRRPGRIPVLAAPPTEPRRRAGVSLAALPDEALLGRAWELDGRVDVETLGRPGVEDPEHIVYRQRYGFGRAVEVDTALGAVLGACDGDLTAGQIIAAVADILDVDPDALAVEVTPKLRDLIGEGYLT